MKNSIVYSLNRDVPIVNNNHEDGVAPYVLKLRDLPPEDKPREKLIKYGASSLSADELLSVVLNVGTKKEDVRSMTKRILREYGEKTIANQRSVERVMKEFEVPETKACQIVACFELGRRFFTPSNGSASVVRTAADAYKLLKNMGEFPKEHLRGLYLNSHYRVVHDEVISIGTVTANIVHPREVFRPALEFGASAVIIAHNHPSGDTTPSVEDIAITKQLVAAGSLLGIELLDHLIVTADGYSQIPVVV